MPLCTFHMKVPASRSVQSVSNLPSVGALKCSVYCPMCRLPSQRPVIPVQDSRSAVHVDVQGIQYCWVAFPCNALQGECSKEDCRYLHQQLPASPPVCRAYAAGFCSKGCSCAQKHLTPKMLRELRASRTLRAGGGKVSWCSPVRLLFPSRVTSALFPSIPNDLAVTKLGLQGWGPARRQAQEAEQACSVHRVTQLRRLLEPGPSLRMPARSASGDISGLRRERAEV